VEAVQLHQQVPTAADDDPARRRGRKRAGRRDAEPLPVGRPAQTRPGLSDRLPATVQGASAVSVSNAASGGAAAASASLAFPAVRVPELSAVARASTGTVVVDCSNISPTAGDLFNR